MKGIIWLETGCEVARGLFEQKPWAGCQSASGVEIPQKTEATVVGDMGRPRPVAQRMVAAALPRRGGDSVGSEQSTNRPASSQVQFNVPC